MAVEQTDLCAHGRTRALLRDQHLALLKGQKVQGITASDIARLLRRMREDGLSGWTASAVFRTVKGVFALAQQRGIVTSDPCDGLPSAEGRSGRTRRRSSAWTVRPGASRDVRTALSDAQ